MKNIYLVLLLCIYSGAIAAQTASPLVLSSTGGESSGSSISTSWSVGEVIIGNFTNSQLDVSNGFQQGWNEVTTFTPDYYEMNSLTVFPNPVQERLFVKYHDKTGEERLSVQIITSDGKVLMNGIISDILSEINFELYPAGSYIVKIHNDNGVFKTFTVIKQTDYEKN